MFFNRGLAALPIKCRLPIKSGGAGRFDYKVGGGLGRLAYPTTPHRPACLECSGVRGGHGIVGTVPAPVRLVGCPVLPLTVLAMAAGAIMDDGFLWPHGPVLVHPILIHSLAR